MSEDRIFDFRFCARKQVDNNAVADVEAFRGELNDEQFVSYCREARRILDYLIAKHSNEIE